RVLRATVGAEAAGHRVLGEGAGAVGLHDGRRKAHRLPARYLDDDAHLLRALAPVLARSVQVPRPRHAHVGVRYAAVLPPDLEVLAPALDALDHGPGRGHDALQPRRLERRGGL